MPAYLTVPPLSFLSLEETADLVVTAVTITNLKFKEFSEETENALQCVADYLSVLPPNISEEFLHYILRIEEFDPIVRYWALKFFLQPHTRALIIGMFPETYYTRLVEVIILQGAGLQVLDLKGVWLNHESSHLLQTILENIQNLTTLNIPHMANDTVLETIGLHNESLQMMDISGDCSITERGTSLLCSNQALAASLQILNVGNPGGEEVEPFAIAQFIKKLPNLISLGPYAHVGKAIVHLISEGDTKELKTNLQHVHDTNTDIKTAKIIIETCPKLQSLYLDQPNENVIPLFQAMSKLDQIKLHKFQCDELKPLLSKIGSSVRSLELILGAGILDLSMIGMTCPQITKFICYKIEIIRHFEQVSFEHLVRLGIFYSDISVSCIKYILSSAQKLEELSIGDLIDISDADIHEILSHTVRENLRDVWFPNARNLTTQSVQCFIENCPNLRSLGELSGWDLSPSDVTDFRAAIQAENIDLRLWEFFG
ncbi:uncharacterized protein [Anabrus simplex]|uniref:uncharacterized protein n=1 Tax=Anabrus simplex TaxID=316456 RepID=UPI0035A2777A